VKTVYGLTAQYDFTVKWCQMSGFLQEKKRKYSIPCVTHNINIILVLHFLFNITLALHLFNINCIIFG